MSVVDEKYKHLLQRLRELKKVAVAFSGGLDSSFLLFASKDALGNQVVALTVKTPYMADWEIDEAREFARDAGIDHRIIRLPFTGEIRNNPGNRCYICKRFVFHQLRKEAEKTGAMHLLDGTNRDDPGDHRPGLKALEELGIISPLRESGLSKDDIRYLARKKGLRIWDKPAYACLLTRIPHNTRIEDETLERIEKAEKFLIDLGIRSVRVRCHGKLARIETTKKNFRRILEKNNREKITAKLKSLGFRYVSLDMEGYRTGSLDISN